LGDLAQQVAHFVTIKFGDRGNGVDVPEQVLGSTHEGRETRLALAPAQQSAVRGDDHLQQPGRGPVLAEQAAEYGLEVFADLDGPQLPSAVPANLVRFTNGEIGGHWLAHYVGCFSHFTPLSGNL